VILWRLIWGPEPFSNGKTRSPARRSRLISRDIAPLVARPPQGRCPGGKRGPEGHGAQHCRGGAPIMGEHQGPMDLAKLLETNAQAAPPSTRASAPDLPGRPDHLGDKSPKALPSRARTAGKGATVEGGTGWPDHLERDAAPHRPSLWGCKKRQSGCPRSSCIAQVRPSMLSMADISPSTLTGRNMSSSRE